MFGYFLGNSLLRTSTRHLVQRDPNQRKKIIWSLTVNNHQKKAFPNKQANKLNKDRSAFFNQLFQGRARTQSPTTIDYAVEIPTFGEFAGISMTGVQWTSLILGEPFFFFFNFIISLHHNTQTRTFVINTYLTII